MGYHDKKFGGTAIRDCKIYNLDVSWDFEKDPLNKTERTAVLTLTPNTDEFEHYHIDLNREEAAILRDWLIAFCDDK